MLKNIVLAVVNCSETVALAACRKARVTTGGWISADAFPRRLAVENRAEQAFTINEREIYRIRDGQARTDSCDRQNAKNSDATLMLGTAVEDEAGRQDFAQRLAPCRAARGTFEELKELTQWIVNGNFEVLHLICLEGPPETHAALGVFLDWLFCLLSAAHELERNAESIWVNRRRVRRRRDCGSPVDLFVSRTSDREQFRPAAVKHACDAVVRSLSNWPIAPSTIARILKQTLPKVDETIDGWRLRRNQRIDQYVWHTLVRPKLVQIRPDLLTQHEHHCHAQEGRLPSDRKLFRRLMKGRHSLPESKFREACEIVSKTRLRDDRGLRTHLLVELAGAREDYCDLLRRIRNARALGPEFTVTAFNKRFAGLVVTPGDEHVGEWRGWKAFRYIAANCLVAGHVSRYAAVHTDPEQLEAELFWFVDEFPVDDRLWTAAEVAGFAAGLWLLCGNDAMLWADWLWPPPLATETE